jgi:SOS-response transcriptional repressor LexA
MKPLNEVQKIILNHIKECMKKGTYHYRSKHIAKDIGGLSPHEVGTNIALMSNKKIGGIKIINYARANSTITWKAIRCSYE